jgi:hypothetical protein
MIIAIFLHGCLLLASSAALGLRRLGRSLWAVGKRKSDTPANGPQ